MIMFSILVAAVFVLGALICYSCCCTAARADRASEEYFRLKMQEKDAKKHHDNK